MTRTLKNKLLLTLVIFSLFSCSAEKTEFEYMESAKNYLDKGDLKSAIIEFKSAIQINPKNNEARYLLAKSYLSIQQGAGAEKELVKAIENGMNQAELFDELTMAYFYQYDFDKLLSTTENVSPSSSNQSAMIFFYRGIAYGRINQDSLAISQFKNSTKSDPSSPFARLSSAYLKLADGGKEEALRIATKVTEDNKTNTEAFILAANIHALNGAYLQSIENLKQAIILEPNRLDLYLQNAKAYNALGAYKDAEKNVDIVLAVIPNHSSSLLMKSSLRLRDKDPEAALRYSEQASASNDGNRRKLLQTRLLSGMANFYLKNWESARKNLSAVISLLPSNHIAHRMLAYTEFQLGNSGNAISSLGNRNMGNEIDDQLLTLFGSQLVSAGKSKEAIELFEKITQENPDKAEMLTYLGLLQFQHNVPSSAATLERSLEKNPDSLYTKYALSQVYLEQGKINEAMQLANSLINSNQDQLAGHLMAASIYDFQKNYANALAHLDSAYAIDKSNRAVLFGKFEIAIKQKKFDDASSSLEKILELDPGDTNALLNMYRLGKTQKDNQQFSASIATALKESPDNDGLIVLHGFILADQKKYDDAINALLQVDDDSKVYGNAQLLLGTLESRRNNIEKALSHFQNVVRANPGNLKGHRSLIGAHIQLNQNTEAIDAIRGALAYFPGDKLLVISEIELMLKADQWHQVQRNIQDFQFKHGQTASLEFVLGNYYADKKEFNTALTHYQAAHDLEPNNRTVITIARLLNKTGNANEATKFVNAWLEKYPDDLVVSQYLKANQLPDDHAEKVSRLYQIIEQNPDHYPALNNLAWALVKSDEIPKALEYAKRAFELQPDLAPILDTYGYLLLLTGDNSQAADLLGKAYEKSHDSPSIAYHYALALKETNEIKKALEVLTPALQKDFSEKEQAKQLMALLRSR